MYLYQCCTVFAYYSFIVLEIKDISSPALFLFRVVLAILGPLHFYVNFRISLSISVKNILLKF